MRKSTGLTEIQTITLSSSKAFIYEVQTISLLNSDETFSLSFNSSIYSNAIPCNFTDTQAKQIINTIKSELESISE